MDESTRFYVAIFQIEGNMKLQLGISQLTLAWILYLWFQAHWGNGEMGAM
jgi:hypothetical protein